MKRDTILDAAATIVSRDGLSSLTHRAVAAEAGVPLGTVTYHFPGIRDLLGEVVLRGVAGVRSTLTRWIRESPGEDPVDVLYSSMLEAHSDIPALAAVYGTYLSAVAEPHLRPVALVASAAASDAIAEAVGPAIGALVSSYMDGIFIRWIVEGVTAQSPIGPEVRAGLAALVHCGPPHWAPQKPTSDAPSNQPGQVS